MSVADVDIVKRIPGNEYIPNDKLYREWDGRKVWVLVEDMWRQATVLACCPTIQQTDNSWGFIVQSKHDSQRNLVLSHHIENSLDFDNIEISDYIDIPNPVKELKHEFDDLPADSPMVNVGTHKCPVHPYVADYIKRLLNQLQLISPSSQKDALVAADAEISRLRIALQGSSDRYFAKCKEYDAYINDLHAELNAMRVRLNTNVGTTAPAGAGQTPEATMSLLLSDNHRLTEENRMLRARDFDYRQGKPLPEPKYKELEDLHKELNRLSDLLGCFTADAIAENKAAATIQRLEQENKKLLETQTSLVNQLRAAGMRSNNLNSRMNRYERNIFELGRPAFDYESSSEIELMMAKIQAEGERLVARMNFIESSLARKYPSGAPILPPAGSFAEVVDGFRLTLTYLEARIDFLTGTTDPKSFSFGRVQELEIEKENMKILMQNLEREVASSNSYLDATMQPVLGENAMLKSQLNDALRRCEGLQETLARKEKSGMFW